MTADGTSRHYEELANRYDSVWEHSPEFVAWMTGELSSRLDIREGDWLLDVGAGTGIYAHRLMDQHPTAVGAVCLDPSEAMLAQIDDPRLHPYVGDESDAEAALLTVGIATAPRVLIKEAVHHFNDLSAGLGLVSRTLSPGGLIVVAMLPPTIDYPLFRAAHELFESRQPHHDDVAGALRKQGLRSWVELAGFELTFTFDRYAGMVRARYMSLLSEFSDQELDAGIAEIAERHGTGSLTFTDRFAFVLGTTVADE